jgi:phytanoyl-CoA hydroxylase
MLNAAQQLAWRQEGCLVLPDFKSAPALLALRQRALEIVDRFDPAQSKTIFTTNDQTRTADDYFMGSADTIRCFFEEEAFDAHGRLKQAKELSINKIGHAMHDLDPVFDTFSRGPKLADLAADLALVNPQLWQSQYIFKQPGIGGEVRWHQDATFFETAPISVTTFWFALEDATQDNGCLWVQPGGHGGPLRERFVRTQGQYAGTAMPQAPVTPEGREAGTPTPPTASPVAMEKLDATPWPDASTAIPLQVSAGSLVVLHGLLPHYSAPNRSARSRHAYTLHATDGRSVYSPRNWLQRGPHLPLRGFE